MDIRRDQDAWHFGQMNPFEADLLRMLPGCAVVDDDKAGQRIFSSVTAGADEEMDAEWKENVEPDLRELFQSHLDVVVGDLAGMKTQDGMASMQFPAAHARAWIHTLNQARLALAARHDFTEDHIEGRRKVRKEDKVFALMQIDIYGTLLSLLLRHTEI